MTSLKRTVASLQGWWTRLFLLGIVLAPGPGRALLDRPPGAGRPAHPVSRPGPAARRPPAGGRGLPLTGRWAALNSPADTVPSHGIRAYGQAFAIDIAHPRPADFSTRISWGLRQRRDSTSSTRHEVRTRREVVRTTARCSRSGSGSTSRSLAGPGRAAAPRMRANRRSSVNRTLSIVARQRIATTRTSAKSVCAAAAGDDHGLVNVTSTESTTGAPGPDVVTKLLADQAPHLADLTVRASSASGSSNWVFRLGDEMAVRLPRADRYVPDLLKEIRWLPHLAPHLAAPVPEVIASGDATRAFPRPWAVLSWIPGKSPGTLDQVQQARLAQSLGVFLQSLHAVETTSAPHGADAWGYRCGEPVTDVIDGWAEQAATDLADLFDPDRVREAWRRLRRVPPATQPACWVHTDLSAENLLTHRDGRLAGVIDFGGIGIGDRSVDLLYAWSLLDAPARDRLRVASGSDEATWVRARAWAFVGPGLATIAQYRHTMPARTSRLIAMVEAVAGEVAVDLR